MNKIVIQKQATVSAAGEHIKRNNKAVICLTTGKRWASGLDAAKEVGVHPSTMSAYCKGKTHHPAGLKFCYVSELVSHIDEIANALEKHGEEELARLMENKRIAEETKNEERRKEAEAKAEAKYQIKLEHATNKLNRAEDKVKKLEEKLREAQAAADLSRQTYNEITSSHACQRVS